MPRKRQNFFAKIPYFIFYLFRLCYTVSVILIRKWGELLSVPEHQRGVSNLEFIYNARQLQIHTLRKCANFPKKYRFSVSTYLEQLARNIHGEVKRGNSMGIPRNQHEFQMRRDCFLRAHADLYDFASQLEVAKEVMTIRDEYGRVIQEVIDDDALQFWTSMIKQEIKLVKGVMESDLKRFKHFL